MKLSGVSYTYLIEAIIRFSTHILFPHSVLLATPLIQSFDNQTFTDYSDKLLIQDFVFCIFYFFHFSVLRHG